MNAADHVGGSFPLATLLVAIAVMAIALAQLIVAKKKLSLDLFDRRYAIYNEYVSFLKLAVGTGSRGSVPNDSKLRELAPQARFLFSREIEEALLVAHRTIDQLWRLNLEITSGGTPPEVSQQMQFENVRLRTVLQVAVENAPRLFGPYLNFGNWRKGREGPALATSFCPQVVSILAGWDENMGVTFGSRGA